MPLTHFILALNPAPKKNIVDAAKKLYYRDHITVNLLVRGSDLFPDNWLYVHSPEVKMARIGNYNNFGPSRKKYSMTALSVEYFCSKGDEVWNKSDEQLIELATKELIKVVLVEKEEDIAGSFVIRETESYPVYFMGHKKYFDLIKSYVEQFMNLQLIGRGGMYRYNNMDHSVYTGFLAARNFNLGYKKFDLWKVNEDAEYLEEKRE